MTITLLGLNEQSLELIEERSRQKCVVLRDHPLPSGCQPDRADIGIEGFDAQGLLIHIRRGIRYSGPDAEIQSWFESGTRAFPTMKALMGWVRSHLSSPGPGYPEPDRATETAHPGRAAEGDPSLDSSTVRPRRAAELTDLSQVQVRQRQLPTADELFKALRLQVVGQDSALRSIAAVAARHLAKTNPQRPATALLIGPTGVGKTLAAEVLAGHLREVTGARWTHLRLDMSEYSEKHTASRLFGSPPGYIGYNDGRDLAAHLRNHPHSVVVFDEIDKAHPSLWFSLMSLMDAGRLATEGSGGDRTAASAILLFTSNKDADALVASRNRSTTSDPASIRALLRERGYPPEIVGRISTVAVFDHLSGDAQAELITRSIERLSSSYGLRLLYVDPHLVSRIASDSPPSEAGARDLEYHIDHLVGDALAQFSRSATTTNIVITDGEPLVIQPAAPVPDGKGSE